ncbi:DUF1573 domain-containing protein [Rikenella microfusus]|uniref:DUF1573 domain-containing protein n=1 Tax=Rikenella microfusus TaxID=28139 RepID=UPI003464D1C4
MIKRLFVIYDIIAYYCCGYFLNISIARKCLFCFGLIASVLCCYGQGKFSFKFRKTTADFGAIDRKATKQIIVNFEFNNSGTVRLVILKVVPMCGS